MPAQAFLCCHLFSYQLPISFCAVIQLVGKQFFPGTFLNSFSISILRSFNIFCYLIHLTGLQIIFYFLGTLNESVSGCSLPFVPISCLQSVLDETLLFLATVSFLLQTLHSIYSLELCHRSLFSLYGQFFYQCYFILCENKVTGTLKIQ